jgi:fructose-1,6-bisphosphatase I
MNPSRLTSRTSLEAFLETTPAAPELLGLIKVVAGACVEISALVRKGALAGDLGAAEGENVQGEVQKKLDVLSNDILVAAAERSGVVAAGASEELEDFFALNKDAPYLLLFDPLDGSSNIDVNVSIGTILSILKRPHSGAEVTAAEFMQKGRDQAAAAYALYGPQTSFILTLGDGVFGFILDPDSDQWLLVDEHMTVAPQASEFAINVSNQRHWAAPMQRYVDECLKGKTGPRGKDFNMRWVGAMVVDVHRILTRGGIFLYPWDAREPDRAGKLRLMYEANPLGLIIEQAGGAISTGKDPILDIQPQALHQRVSVVLGTRDEVAYVTALHSN